MLKALIINRNRPGRELIDKKRFQKLIKTLKKGGIEARYHTLETKQSLLALLEQKQPDLVYCANYYVLDEDNRLTNAHALIDEFGICRVGSAVDALELVLSKSALKQQWVRDHIATPRFFVLSKENGQVSGLETALKSADYPYILKPDREGNSRGLDSSSIVFNAENLYSKAQALLTQYKQVMVEKFLGEESDLHEYTVAMIGSGEQKLLLPAEIRLKTRKRLRIVTTADKDQHRTQAVAVRDKALYKKLTSFASKAFASAGVRDYARLDVLSVKGELFAIEINGLSMIPDKWFEECSRSIRMQGDQYLNAIFLSSIVREGAEGNQIQVPTQMKQALPGSIFAALGAG